MRKFAVVIGIVIGLVVVPRIANASPIGTNGCVIDAAGISECDIYVDANIDGSSDLGAADGNLGGYLPGYVVVLNNNADLSTIEDSDVAHILVIQDQLFQLYSNTGFNLSFAGILETALKVGGSAGQIAGCPPVPSGIPKLPSGVGFCTNADLITLDQTIVWSDGFGGGGNDTLRIHTALPIGTEQEPAPVPEPGTLTLLGFGGSAAVASIRRRRATK